MPTLPDAAQTAISIGVGIVFGGTIIRFLVSKWLKDREDFEKGVQAEFRALNVAIQEAKGYADRGDRAIREEGIAARDAMVKGAEHEFKILRDRWHALDTLTQVLVNNIGLMREEIKEIAQGQRENTESMHKIETSLSRIPGLDLRKL